MDLSVIIVNYNVSLFLEQCILSVQKALQGIQAEIIVVDNKSIDDSCDMVRTQFKQVILIENNQNYGFAKANNIGINRARGRNVLLLNPDTIVHENCLKLCLQYLNSHENVGALGVKMIDGSGKILPESKRGFPTAWVSFCKMSGLYKLFPHSKFFNGYYLGHLSYDSNCEVDVLTGAFFMSPMKVLQKISGLDESFFMYGEDIDLSHRIKQEGYKLIYLSNAQIIHFKGESTKKSSINYWFSFYSAMMIFSKKHQKNTSLLFLLKIAIFVKGILSFIKSVLKRTGLMLIDGLAIISGFYAIKYFWSNYFYKTPYHFQTISLWFNGLLYAFIWIACFFLLGVYDKRFKKQDLVLASIIGFIINLGIYALIPEGLRSSRMVLGLTFILVLLYLTASRFIFNKLKLFSISSHKDLNRILILGSEEEKTQVFELIKSEENNFELAGIISADRSNTILTDRNFIQFYNPSQVIACPSVYNSIDITSLISNIPDSILFKILNPSGKGIIGSSNRKSSGELFTFENTWNLNKEKYKRQKRFFDLSFGFVVLLFSWILIFFQKNKLKLFQNILDTLLGVRTWVGISPQQEGFNLIGKKAVFLLDQESDKSMDEIFIKDNIRNYCRNYSIWMDLNICLNDFEKLSQ